MMILYICLLAAFSIYHARACNYLYAGGFYIITFIVFDIMATDKTSINFQNSKAMFEKLNGGSATFVQQKKQPVVYPIKPPQVTIVQKNSSSIKGLGEVDTAPIVKPNAIKQALQSNIVSNTNGSINKLASSFANNPWVQQNSTVKFVQKTTPPVKGKQSKPENTQNTTFKKTFSETQPEETKSNQTQNVVKVTENALVDKQSLPNQDAMKKLIEQRLVGIIGVKKLQETPRITPSNNTDQGPRQAPVVQTEIKIRSVKQNANRLNDFYQNRQTQKRQAEQIEAKKQHQEEELTTEKKQQENKKNSQNEKSQTAGRVPQQNNTMNISAGFLSEAPEEPIQTQNSFVSSVPSSEPSEPSVAMTSLENSKEGQQSNLINRLNKRKKTTKKIFDSDDD